MTNLFRTLNNEKHQEAKEMPVGGRRPQRMKNNDILLVDSWLKRRHVKAKVVLQLFDQLERLIHRKMLQDSKPLAPAQR